MNSKVETSTERGERIANERAKAVRPVIRKQADLMVTLAAKLARDAASGLSSQISYIEAVDAGLDRRLADFVRDGCKPK